MTPLIIALLAGLSAAAASYALSGVLERWGSEKRFKDFKDPGVERVRKDVKSYVLFAAEKIGTLLLKREYHHLKVLASEIAEKGMILANPLTRSNPYTFIGLQCLSGIAVMLLAIILIELYNVIVLLIMGIVGFIVPLLILRERAAAKHKAIFRQLPDVLDMLALMIDAGLDFNSAFARVMTSERGALIDEFHHAQQEIELGKSRHQAFEDMSRKLRSIPLTTVVNALNLALRSGVGLSQSIKTLSEQIRTERFQAAEKMAGEAPVKMLVPLVLLIFPTIFIILFGPVMLSFIGSK